MTVKKLTTMVVTLTVRVLAPMSGNRNTKE
jgi:hypothetical protein